MAGKRDLRSAPAPGAVTASISLALLAPVPDSLAQLRHNAEESVDEIVVTGSRIKRQDFYGPGLKSVIEKDTLEFSGESTIEETLELMPQFIPDYGRTANNPGNGTARLNLRGLGSQRTLVLLNGRRLAPSGVGSSVDVNILPQALVERVEIVTGGAATIYGSDAMTGVVNFITRSDFDDFGLDASAYMTEKGDSDIYDLNLTYGHNFSNGRGNITVFGGVLDRDPIFAGDRDISTVPLTDTWLGELVEGGSTRVPAGYIASPLADLGNGPVDVTFDRSGGPVEAVFPDFRYNFLPVNYLQIPMRRYSVGLFLDYQLSDRVETYFEITHARNEVQRNLAPVPADDFVTVNTDNPVLTPEASLVFRDNYVPMGGNTVGFSFQRRLTELGPRVIKDTRDYSRIVAGLRGNISEDWAYDAWLTYTNADEESLRINDASRTRLQQGLLVDPVIGECFDTSNGCVPLNLFGEGNLSAEGVAFIRLPDLVNVTMRSQKLASAAIIGAPFETWAGPVETAFGLEWRSDTGSFHADDYLFTGDALGFSGRSSVNGTESVYEFYGEALIPLAQNARFADYLAIELGGRLSEYKNAGEANSYKIGGVWQPFEWFRIRAMFEKSARAPNLEEAFQEQLVSPGTFVDLNPAEDPCSASAAPINRGNLEKCVIQGIPEDQVGTFEAAVRFPMTRVTGGNPGLIPETAITHTAGIVVNLPYLPKWQFSADYFEVKVTDAIGELSATEVCFDPLNNPHLFCQNLRRDPLTYNVTEIFQPVSNLGAMESHGLDVQVHYRTELPGALSIGDSAADLAVDFIWTRIYVNSIRLNPAASKRDCAGYFGWPCTDYFGAVTFPRNRVTMDAHYTSGDFSTHLSWRTVDNVDNAARWGAFFVGWPYDPVDLAIAKIEEEHYFDLGFGYRFTDNVHARLNVANVLGTDPPLMADSAGPNNTDTGMYDVFGRSYSLGLSLRY